MSEPTEVENKVKDTTMNEEKPEQNTEIPEESNGHNGTSEKEGTTNETKDVTSEQNKITMKEESTENNIANGNETKDDKKEENDDNNILLNEKIKNDEKEVKKEEPPQETKEVSKEVLAKVGERLQFFFSDVNLRSDRFMNNTMRYNQNMIPYEIMARFKTIQQYSSDPSIIKQAAHVHCSDFLRTDENGVGRIIPYDSEKGRGSDIPLTLFVDNLPLSNSGMSYDCTVRDIIDTFKDYGKVALVRLRYSKEFKRREKQNALGNSFVEFATKEEFDNAKKDLIDGQTPNRALVLKGKDLKITTMADWLEWDKNNRSNNYNKTERNDKKSDPEKLENEDVVSFEKGGVITLKGVPTDCSRESILSAIQEFSHIWKVPDDNVEEKVNQKTLTPLSKRNVFIDYSRNQPDGAIRFTNVCISEHKDKIAELANKLKLGEIKINHKAVEDASVLEGEEEEKYWKKVMEFQKMKNSHQKRKKDFRDSRKPFRRQQRQRR